MSLERGMAKPEPWIFPTFNVRKMLAEANEIIERASDPDQGCWDFELMVAINHLHHAAAELQRDRLVMTHGVKRL